MVIIGRYRKRKKKKENLLKYGHIYCAINLYVRNKTKKETLLKFFKTVAKPRLLNK